MADEVRQWSDELARDPASLVFLPLAETLRRQGQVALAQKVALRGLQRHPHHVEAHDLLARIFADLGDLQSAFDEWDMVLRLAPGHVGSLKGMAFIRFQQGRMEESEQLLVAAQSQESDEDLTAAMTTVRNSVAMVALGEGGLHPFSDPRRLYGDLLSPEQAGTATGFGSAAAATFKTGSIKDS